MAAGDLALRILITASGSQALAELGVIKGAVRDVGSGISMAGLVAAAGLAAIGLASVKAAGDFEQQMLHVQVLAGLTGKQYTDMTNTILAMAPQVGQAPVTLAKGLFQIVSSLIPANEWTQTLYESGILASTGMADEVQVAKVLSTIMNIYGMDATTAANDVTAAVTYGRMTMTDYANSIGLVVQKGKSAGFSFNELNAALDVMTTHGFPSAQQASRNLGQLFVQMDLGMDAMTKRAHGMGLTFDEGYFKTQGLAGQIAYLNKVTHGNAAELHTLIGGGVYAFQTFETLSGAMGAYGQILGTLQGAQSGVNTAQAKWDATQKGFNVQFQKFQAGLQVILILIGTQLIPVLENLMAPVMGLVNNFISWVASGKSVADYLSLTGSHAQVLIPILAGLGALLVALIVPALWAMATALFMNPITWIVIAVVALTAAFIHFYQTNAGFRALMDKIGEGLKQLGGWIQSTVLPALKQFGEWLQKNVLPPLEQVWASINKNFVPTLQTLASLFMTRILPILQEIGGYLIATFKPVWTQLQLVWQNSILPSLKQLWAALQPMLPLLKLIGEIIGAVLITVLGLLVAAFTGVIKGIAGFMQGLAWMIGGIVQIFTGIIQIVTGFLSFFYDLVTGNWKKLGADVDQIFTGMKNVIGGIFQAIGGFFGGMWNMVTGALQGFWDGIVGFFTKLWDKLTGHSIVPDMIKDIVSVFAGLPASALKAIGGLVGNLMSFFGGLATQAVTWGVNIIKNIAGGILSGIGSFIGNAMSSLGSFVHDHLPHSPAKMGPLKELAYQGSQIPQQIAEGIIKGAPKLQGALRTSLALPALSQSNAFALQVPSNQNQTMNMTIQLDSKQLTQALGVRMAKEIRIQGNVRGR